MTRTTVDLDPELVKKVIAVTGESTKGRALNHVMEEFLRERAKKRLLAARGMFPDMEDRTEEWEEQEMRLEEEHKRERGW